MTGFVQFAGIAPGQPWLYGRACSYPNRVRLPLNYASHQTSDVQGSKKSQIPLVLCCLNDRVRGIFEIARLHTVFKIVGTRADAMVG